MPPGFALGKRGALEDAGDFRLPSAKYVLIAGCRANELSNEGAFGDVRNGALTHYLAEALLAAGGSTTYRDVMGGVGADVTSRYPAQHPQVEGTGVDQVIFGDHDVVSRPFVLIEPAAGSGARIGAGSFLGLAAGDKLKVFAPGTKAVDPATPPTGEVELVDVDLFEARGQVLAGGTIAPHSRAFLDAVRPAGTRVGVWLEGVEASPVLREVRRQIELGDYEALELAAAPDAAAIRVRASGNDVRLEDARGELLSTVSASATTLAEAVVVRVAHWSRWFAILAIRNVSPTVDIDLRVWPAAGRRDDPPVEQWTAPRCDGTERTQIAIEVGNRSSKPLHLVLLDLASDGSVTVLYPIGEGEEPIPAGATKTLDRIRACIPADRESVRDVVKAIATTSAVDPALFRLGPVPRSKAVSVEEDALSTYLRLAAQGLTRNFEAGPTGGWATEERQMTLVAPPARAASIALHFAAGRGSDIEDRLRSAGGRAPCGAAADPNCIELNAFPGEPTIVEVRTPEMRAIERGGVSIGTAFDEAYNLADTTGAARAEPLLELALPRAQTAPSTGGEGERGLSGAADDPRAAADPLWSQRFAAVTGAWRKLRDERGRLEGAEARGVIIGHPDTGYRQHPEIWSPDPALRPLWPERGYDYFAADADPTDDLLAESLLDNPAHGTGSSSAIVSPTGCQLAGVTNCPTGVARGARLIPLRIHSSVVVLSQRNLALAILDAAGSDRTRLKERPDLLSIAMGGPPTWTLWKAVRKAEQSGVLVIAAAGNYVRTVVWPARFPETIAVAAVNIGCRPWAHTSLGPAVDFSAPGESVWRAALDEANLSSITGMGTGTTYATSTTAGVAALWVAYHAGEPAFEDLRRRGRLTRAFRDLVRATSWRPDRPGSFPAGVACDAGADWSPLFYGAGIIDAEALLAAPLPAGTGGSRGAVGAEVSDLPLWRSLYPIDVEPGRPADDYLQLFGGPVRAELESVARFESEVLHHVALDADLSGAVESWVAGAGRDGEALERVRRGLRGSDLSARLREALP